MTCLSELQSQGVRELNPDELSAISGGGFFGNLGNKIDQILPDPLTPTVNTIVGLTKIVGDVTDTVASTDKIVLGEIGKDLLSLIGENVS